MTDTQIPATQAQIDADTYDAYIRNSENKAAAAREVGVNPTTVADRIKRHLARHEQDTLADSRALDAEQAAQDAEYAADSEAAELPDSVHGGDVFARIEASDPEMRFIDETVAAFDGKPVTEDPDESVTALLEDGEPAPAADAYPVAVAVDDTVVALTRRIDITGQDDEVAPAAELAGADVLAQLIKARGAEHNDDTVPAPAQTRKAAGRASKPAPAVLPEGVVTPIEFRDLLVAEGLAPETLPRTRAYSWVRKCKSFPAKHYGPDGAVYDEPQHGPDGKAVTRPGVLVDAARDWHVARGVRHRPATAA